MAIEHGTTIEAPKAETYKLADLVVDVGTRQVQRGAERIALPDLSFSLLVALLRAAPNLVTYDELMRQVWPGLVVSPETITQRVKLVRDALGDDARSPRYIAGVRSRGYRIIAELGAPASAPKRAVARSRLKVLATAFPFAVLAAVGWWFVAGRDDARGALEEPSILVLPLRNLSDAPDMEYFAAGVHEDMLARLARIHGLKVISRTTALALARSNASVPEVAAEADVTRVLAGSIRRQQDRVRLTVQLISAPAEQQMWAETYDREVSDIFAVQDELAQAIAEQLRIRLDPKILASFATAPTQSIEAYDLVLRTAESRRVNPRDFEKQVALLERAIALDPNYAEAHAMLADARFPNEGPEWKDIRARAIANIEKALAIDPENARALTALAYVTTRDGYPVTQSLPYMARAIASAPGNPLVQRMYGNRQNGYRERIRHWEEAYRLDPLEPLGAPAYAQGLLEQGRFGDALRIATKAVRHHPTDAALVDALANVYLEMGDGLAALRKKRRAAELDPVSALHPQGRYMQGTAPYTRVLMRFGLHDAAEHWLDAIESSPTIRASTSFSRAMACFLGGDAETLARHLDAWPADTGNIRQNASYFRALLEAQRADGAFDRGDATSRSVHLAQALQHFADLFAAFPEVETPGARAFAFPGDVTWMLVRYATVARGAGDDARAQRIIAHLDRILTEQIAPEGAPVDRAMLAALVGDRTRALAELERAGPRLTYFLTHLGAYGVIDDRERAFHGLAKEARFSELIAKARAEREALTGRITREAPELLEPGDAFTRRSRAGTTAG